MRSVFISKTYGSSTYATLMTKLWAMFFFSVLLVTAMNWYAIEREPDRVYVGDLHEYKNTVVKVQGQIVSWVEDPYGDGSERVDVIIEDETGVVEVRWYKFSKLPGVGSTIHVVGDVIEYDGRFWIQALGSGSVTWSATDEMKPEEMGEHLTAVSQSPEAYTNRIIELTGYISEAIPPNGSYHSLSLMDHPQYSNSKHLLQLQLYSASGRWIEAGSKVNVSGEMRYDEREYRWKFYAQTNAISVDSEFIPYVQALDWDDQSSWSYSENKLVTVSGIIRSSESQNSNSTLWISNVDSTSKLCFLISNSQRDNVNFDTELIWTGRLIWVESMNQFCLFTGGDSGASQIMDIQELLNISQNPTSKINDGLTITVEGWLTQTIAPDYDEGYIADGPDYYCGFDAEEDCKARNTRIRMQISGSREQYLETGEKVMITGKIKWDIDDSRMIIEVSSLIRLGGPPIPEQLLWTDGPKNWLWGAIGGTKVQIEGHLNQTEDGWWINKPGSSFGSRICINTINDYTNLLNENTNTSNASLSWVGRLIYVDDFEEGSVVLCLDRASPDTDEDGISDFDETNIYNSNPLKKDSDEDGYEDGVEIAMGTNPTNQNDNPSS